MAEEPTPRQRVIDRLVAWVTGITTFWQLTIFVLLGASVLAGTLLYQHPEWITMVLQARLGGPP